MKKYSFLVLIFCICKIHAISTDDFIVKSQNDQNQHNVKIYLGRIWNNVQIDDNLIDVRAYENWSGYKDVIMYLYENIEIVTAKVISDMQYRLVVDISITGNKFSIMNEITIGSNINEVEALYGKPQYTLLSEMLTYSVYRINDPHSDWDNNIKMYNISFIQKENIITKIQIHYVYNI